MEHNRALRAPSTITKPPNVNTYNGPLAQQTKLKTLFSTGPCQTRTRLALGPQVQVQNLPSSNVITNSGREPAAVNVTIRKPLKPSGLVKPTPARYTISAASSNSSNELITSGGTTKRPPQPAINNSNSRLPTLKLQPIKSATVKKSAVITQPKPPIQTTKNASSSEKIDFSVFNSITGDVGEIRRLLEQLLGLLQNSSDSNESLIRENERLKSELAEFKSKFCAIKSTVTNSRGSIIHEESDTKQTRIRCPLGSEIYYTPSK